MVHLGAHGLELCAGSLGWWMELVFIRTRFYFMLRSSIYGVVQDESIGVVGLVDGCASCPPLPRVSLFCVLTGGTIARGRMMLGRAPRKQFGLGYSVSIGPFFPGA